MICSNCGEETKNYFEVEGDILCEECYDDLCEECDECGTAYYSNNMICFDGYYFCQNCYDEEVSTCSECGEEFLTNEMEEFDDSLFCPNCYNKIYKIEEYHNMKNYEEILFFKNKEEDDEKNLYLGVELEVDSKNYINDRKLGECAKEIGEIMPKNFIFFENDGSLDYGFENITQPATFKYHKSILEKYEEMFKTIKSYGLVSHDKGTCGLHIHINRDFLEDNEDLYITRMLYLFERFWENITKFSRRKQSEIERWCGKYNNTPEEIVKQSKEGSLDRYYAINLTNENTIEFRIFRGTLKLNTFISAIQFVDTFVKKCVECKNVEELQDLKWEDFLIYDEIKEYWEEVKNRSV